MTIALFLLGFVLLYYGAEWLVAGAAAIATHFNASKSVVGLTLVAFGTSAPEMVVNVFAAENPRLALSNIAGSNLTNLCIGFGLSAFVGSVLVERRRFGVDLGVLVLAPAIVLGAFLLGSIARPSLPYETVWILMSVLGVYIVLLARRRDGDQPFEEDKANVDPDPRSNVVRHMLEFGVGCVLLYLGGDLVYRNALALAVSWDVPEQIIGLTLVACGTSIPDVTASVVAVRRKEHEIAAGNLIGSNISNILVVLTATMLVSGKSLQGAGDILVDYIAVVSVSLAFAVYALVRERLDRVMGTFALISFIIYFALRIAWTTGAIEF